MDPKYKTHYSSSDDPEFVDWIMQETMSIKYNNT